MKSVCLGLVGLIVMGLGLQSQAAAGTYLAQSQIFKAVQGDSSFNFNLGEKKIVVSTAELPQSAEDLKSELPREKGPAIWITEGQTETVVDLRKVFAKRFPERVFVDSANKSAWVLLEWGSEGPTGELVVLSTKDAGKTWVRLADLKKPPFKFPPSTLDSFFMDLKGNGKAVFKNERQDAGPKVDSEDYYVVTTSNGGRTWKYSKMPWAKNSLTDVQPSSTSAPAK